VGVKQDYEEAFASGLVEFLHSTDPTWATKITRERLTMLRLFAERGDVIATLQREVAHYLDNPGCNARKQATAMRRLRWALEQSGWKSE